MKYPGVVKYPIGVVTKYPIGREKRERIEGRGSREKDRLIGFISWERIEERLEYEGPPGKKRIRGLENRGPGKKRIEG